MLLTCLIPGLSATRFKKVETLPRNFFQAPEPPISKRWSACVATCSTTPVPPVLKRWSSYYRTFLPGPCVTRFKKVERLCRTFFQAPVSPVSKRWNAYVAPSSRSHCHPFQTGGALVSHLLCNRLSCSIASSLPLPSAFSLVSRAGTAARDEPQDLKRTDLFKQEEEDLEEQGLCLWML